MKEVVITCVLGIGIVFLGLVCIIALVEAMHYVYAALTKNKKADTAEKSLSPAVQSSETIANRGEVVAAVAAVIAEDLGKDVNAIRIKSFKKI